MKKIITVLLVAASLCGHAQDLRQFTPEEKATHTKNVTGIMGKWKTTETAIKIVEDALKPKQAELEKVYGGLFTKSEWDFVNTGKCSLTTFGQGTPAPEQGTFTVTAQFLTLYLSGKTYRCLMKIEDDGKLIIHFPITTQSIYALQLEKAAK
jgi:hypothetical protein